MYEKKSVKIFFFFDDFGVKIQIASKVISMIFGVKIDTLPKYRKNKMFLAILAWKFKLPSKVI